MIMAKQLDAASAWWGYATAADKNRIIGFLWRRVRSGYIKAEKAEHS